MPEGVIILEPGDAQSQKIARAMASPTAGEIIKVIASGEKTSSDVANTLEIPITTAKYHIENLLDAGLIEIARRKYSVKGREVKVYRLTDSLVIMAPKRTDIRSLLARFAGLFLVLAIAGILFTLFLQTGSSYSATVPAGGADKALLMSEGRMSAPSAALPDMETGIPVTGVIVSFFLGGVVVLLAVLAIDILAAVRSNIRKGSGMPDASDDDEKADKSGDE